MNTQSSWDWFEINIISWSAGLFCRSDQHVGYRSFKRIITLFHQRKTMSLTCRSVRDRPVGNMEFRGSQSSIPQQARSPPMLAKVGPRSWAHGQHHDLSWLMRFIIIMKGLELNYYKPLIVGQLNIIIKMSRLLYNLVSRAEVLR